MLFSPIPVQSWQDRLLRRLGGGGALCALAVLVLGMGRGFLSRDGEIAELFILTTPIVTPLFLLPTVGALYAIYRPTAPRLSRVLLGLAGVGAAAITVLSSFYLLGIPTAPMQRNPFLFVCYGLLLANGFWPILAGGIEVTRPIPLVGGYVVWGAVAGGLLTVFLLCCFAISWPPIRTFLATDTLISLTLPVLLITHGVWLAGLGYQFLIDP